MENRSRTGPKVKPIRLAYRVQSIRSPGAEFYRPACGFLAVVLTILADYLGTEASCATRPQSPIRHGDRNLRHDHLRQARRRFREQVRPLRGAEVQGRGAPQQAAG